MDEKQKVVTVVNKKQLASVMNNTKWEQLQKCVIDTLPFTPPYQVKYVLEDAWYWGDWEQGLRPFYSIEWLRIRPRYVKSRGRLIEPERFDITDEFIELLQKLNIPFVKEDSIICIYGYVKSTETFNY